MANLNRAYSVSISEFNDLVFYRRDVFKCLNLYREAGETVG